MADVTSGLGQQTDGDVAGQAPGTGQVVATAGVSAEAVEIDLTSTAEQPATPDQAAGPADTAGQPAASADTADQPAAAAEAAFPDLPPPIAELGPTAAAWREQALADAGMLHARAAEFARDPEIGVSPLLLKVVEHLDAARRSAASTESENRTFVQRLRAWAGGSDVERTMSNLDHAHALLLRVADENFLRGHLPALLSHTRHHLPSGDARRGRMEELARKAAAQPLTIAERESIAAIFSDACTEARGEVRRVRSFRNVLIATAAVLTVLAGALAAVGYSDPSVLPLCFGEAAEMICPRGSSPTRLDVPLVMLVGLVAAAVAAAAALRKIRGTSTPFGVPVALAILKLPTGALTAVVGLLLMRAEFVPGLSMLDFPAQIVGWAVIFGYAQELFTRLVDQQAQRVLDDVGGSIDRATTG